MLRARRVDTRRCAESHHLGDDQRTRDCNERQQAEEHRSPTDPRGDPFGECRTDHARHDPRRRQHGEHPRSHVDRIDASDGDVADRPGRRRRRIPGRTGRRRGRASTAPAPPPRGRPRTGSGPRRYGRPSPCRSAWPPAKTMPIMVPRKNAVVTQPYQANPVRSSSMSGRIVMTANDSNATSVTIDTSPIVRERCSGPKMRDRGSVGERSPSTCMVRRDRMCGPRPSRHSRPTGWPRDGIRDRVSWFRAGGRSRVRGQDRVHLHDRHRRRPR